MSLSLGPFITCFLCTNILCIILHYLIYKKKIFFDKSLRFIFWIIGIILLRMVLPFNFPFTYTSYSDNILPKIVDFISYKITTWENNDIRYWFDYLGDRKYISDHNNDTK